MGNFDCDNATRTSSNQITGTLATVSNLASLHKSLVSEYLAQRPIACDSALARSVKTTATACKSCIKAISEAAVPKITVTMKVATSRLICPKVGIQKLTLFRGVLKISNDNNSETGQNRVVFPMRSKLGGLKAQKGAHDGRARSHGHVKIFTLQA
jgi:hypothetical protein